MRRLALLGKDIQHSRSQEIYQKILNEKVSYTLFDYSHEDEIPELSELFRKIDGLSITSPYKRVFLEDVIIDDEIKKIKAINCIKKNQSNFYATNTDYLAMNELIKIYFKGKKRVFILGDGAMGNLTKLLCEKFSIEYKVFSRRLNNFTEVELLLADAPTLLINSCAREFIFDQKLGPNTTFWDLNYNMSVHESHCIKQKVPYIDGMSLLELQAKFALNFWDK